jgi:drug/metabolite transporter (DMT)-like permease
MRPVTTGATPDVAAFTTRDWALLAFIAAQWGSANFLIAEALDSFRPGLITLIRVAVGFGALLCLPSARRPIDRADWPRVALLGVTWIAFPFTLFPIAQTRVSSSLAGMLIGALPIFTAVIAATIARQLPPLPQMAGFAVGLIGVIFIASVAASEHGSTAVGAVIVMIAVLSYAVAINVAVPLQRRYGGPPILVRALGVATVLVIPFGLVSVPDSTVSAKAVACAVALGVFPSAIAYIAFAAFAGRVGGPRASSANYFVPVVAVFLGAVIRNEDVRIVALVGSAFVVAGAGVIGRGAVTPPR